MTVPSTKVLDDDAKDSLQNFSRLRLHLRLVCDGEEVLVRAFSWLPQILPMQGPMQTLSACPTRKSAGAIKSREDWLAFFAGRFVPHCHQMRLRYFLKCPRKEFDELESVRTIETQKNGPNPSRAPR
jgi:hypothetical protein